MQLSTMLIAACIWHEARGEGRLGMKWQASTIWNNAGGKPEKVAEVATNPRLYSCWKRAIVPDPDKMPPADKQAWGWCAVLAMQMEEGLFRPVTDAKYYHDPRISEQEFRRRFARKIKRVGRQGRLTYYGDPS